MKNMAALGTDPGKAMRLRLTFVTVMLLMSLTAPRGPSWTPVHQPGLLSYQSTAHCILKDTAVHFLPSVNEMQPALLLPNTSGREAAPHLLSPYF